MQFYHLRILVSLNNASQNPLSCLRFKILRQEDFFYKIQEKKKQSIKHIQKFTKTPQKSTKTLITTPKYINTTKSQKKTQKN